MASCPGGASDCLYALPSDLSRNATALGELPRGWVAESSQGVAVLGDGTALFALAVNVANFSINYDTLFGLTSSGEITTRPQRAYGGPIITFSLLGSTGDTVLALQQHNDKTTPGYYLQQIDPATFIERGAPLPICPNVGADKYPAVVGGTAETAVFGFYSKATNRRDHVLPPGDTLPSGFVKQPAEHVDLVIWHSGEIQTRSRWDSLAINFAPMAAAARRPGLRTDDPMPVVPRTTAPKVVRSDETRPAPPVPYDPPPPPPPSSTKALHAGEIVVQRPRRLPATLEVLHRNESIYAGEWGVSPGLAGKRGRAWGGKPSMVRAQHF